jgi:hypothetical protein
MRRIIIVLLLMMVITSVCSAKVEMRCQPDVINIEIDDTFSVDVVVKPDQKIDTVAIDLMSWDKGILEFVGVEQGDLFNNSLVWINGTVNIGNYTSMCWGCDVPTNTEGVFARFTFKGIRNGTSIISLNGVGAAFAGVPLKVLTKNMTVRVGHDLKELPVFFIFSMALIFFLIIASIFVIKMRSKAHKTHITPKNNL